MEHMTISPRDITASNFLAIKDKTRAHSRTINFGMLSLETLPPREFLLERFNFEKGSLINLCGSGSSGKTLFAQYLALCISQAQAMFGKFPIEGKTKKVLHVDQEQTESLTNRRYMRLAAGLGLKQIQNNIDRIKLDIKLDDPHKTSNEMLEHLVESWKGYDIIIIDSLRQAVIQDENNSQISEPISLLKRVAEVNNCVILMIHHKGKGPTGSKQSGRGSSAIYDGVDVQIDLESDNNGLITLSCAKNRDGVYFAGVSYLLEDRGEYIQSQRCQRELTLTLLDEKIKVTDSDRQKQIIDAVKAAGKQNQKNLFSLVKGSRDSFDKLIDQMLQQKLLTEEAGPKNARIFSPGENIPYAG